MPQNNSAIGLLTPEETQALEQKSHCRRGPKPKYAFDSLSVGERIRIADQKQFKSAISCMYQFRRNNPTKKFNYVWMSEMGYGIIVRTE